jgi:hypothetical protein
MRLPRAVLVVLLLPLGCLHEYHPEYHPQSAYTYVENISYPTTVYEVQAPVGASDGRAPARGEHRALAQARAPSSVASAPRPAGPPVSIRDSEGIPRPRDETRRADHDAASVAVTWPEADASFRDLFAAERERVRARSQARSADPWEQVVGKPRPGGGMTDVVVDVPVKDAREIAERTPIINVPCMLPGFHAARYGTVVEIRNHPQADGFAQVLLKVDARWDAAWADARGKEVAASFELGPRHLLVVGHVAGPAAEGTDEALRRSGGCRSDASGGLRCGRSRVVLLAQAFD